MSEQEQEQTPPPRKRRLLRRILIGLGVLLALIACFVAALPLFLSADFTRARLEAALSGATGKPATLRELSFSWSDGLRLKGLAIGTGDLNDPNFLATLESLHADVGLLALAHKDLRLTLALSGLRLRLPPASGAPKPEPPRQPLSKVLRQGFDSLRQGLDLRDAAANAHLDVDIRDVTVRMEANGKPLLVRLDALRLNAPDLKAAPLDLSASAALHPGDAPPLPVGLKARLDNLTDASGRIDPARGRLDATLDAPGLALRAAGSLQAGLRCDTRVDLRPALAAAAPLAAPPLPETAGKLSLVLTLSRPEPKLLLAGLEFAAQDLRVRGGPLGGKAVGPLEASLRQEARLDLEARTADLPGSLDLGSAGRLPWRAGLTGVSEDAPRVSLDAGPAHLTLGPLLSAVRAFLPQGLELGALDLGLRELNVSALLPDAGGLPGVDLSLSGLELRLRGFVRRQAGGALRLDAAEISLPEAKASLPGGESKDRGKAELQLAAALSGLRLEGAAPLRLDKAELSGLRVQASELRPSKAALYGLAGTAGMELRAALRGLEAQGKASVPQLTAAARLDASLPEEKRLEAALRECSVDAPLLRLPQPGRKPVETPLSLRAEAASLRLSGAPPVPGVQGLRLRLDLGQALRCDANVDLAGERGRSLRTDGDLRLDAARLLALAAPLAPHGVKAAGNAEATWRMAAELPESAQHAPAAKQPAKLSERIRALAFLREVDATLRLDGLSLDWPLAAQPDGTRPEPLRLRGVGTPRPLHLTTRNGLGESSLSGSVAFGPLPGLPGLPPLPRAVSGLFTLNVAQQGARSAQVAQVLHMDGLGVDQNLNLTLDRLDKLLDRTADMPAAALELADATASFRLAADLRGLSGLSGAKANALSGSGRLEASGGLHLSAGRALDVSARLWSPGLDLRLGRQTSLEGLTADLLLGRHLTLAPGLRCPGESGDVLQRLSEQVFDQFPPSPAARPRTEALGQLLRADGLSRRATGGTLAVGRLRVQAAGLPLDIRDLRLVLDDSGPVPGLRSFRAGLLGGSVLGSASLGKDAGLYGLNADMAFTGIDPGRLLPDKAVKDLGDRAETAGRLTLFVPLTPEPELLLQRLNLRADLTKIGPRTLERMLYALDPEEKNEAIVQQRRLMGIGYPRWLRMNAAYGNLSVSGAVDVKGFQLDLPQVDRLPMGNLPLRKQLQKPLTAVPGLVKTLDAASGAFICRDPGHAGALRFLPTQSPQGASR